MSSDNESSGLPAQIADAIVTISKNLMPGVVKALDRLLGAAVDVPVSLLQRQKAKIDAQTESYKLVESSIAQAAAAEVGRDAATIQRAMDVLVRREYQKQVNRDGVAAAMLENLRNHPQVDTSENPVPPAAELEDDWLNVFERYAEDASSERLQGLWGRVLAGEIRRPGRFSTRTLRFLSEFSQADALLFENFAKCAFGFFSPKNLVSPPEREDISDLLSLEESGLLLGASGSGLTVIIPFGESGMAAQMEGDLALLFKGEPNSELRLDIVRLTSLGQELLSLVTTRDARAAAEAVAAAMRTPEIHECYLGYRTMNDSGQTFHPMKVLWLKDNPDKPIVEGTPT